MNKLEQLEQQLAAMQQELEELKKAKEEENPKAMLPAPDNLMGYRLSLTMDFPDQETAKAYADVFRVMLELRRMPGSGQLDEDEDGWSVDCYGETCWFKARRNFVLCPPFPSRELAQQAAESVGIERIKKAYATLSNIKGEVE